MATTSSELLSAAYDDADRTIDLRARVSPLARRDDIDTLEFDDG